MKRIPRDGLSQNRGSLGLNSGDTLVTHSFPPYPLEMRCMGIAVVEVNKRCIRIQIIWHRTSRNSALCQGE